MPAEKTVQELVGQLKQAGLRPSERLVERILSHGVDAREPLIALATETALLYEAEPLCWGPIHALRLLGEVPDAAMIEPLLRMTPVTIRDEDDQAPELWADDVLEIIARCGAVAIPHLWAWAADETHSYRSRGAALHAMAHVVYSAPEARDDVVQEARARLSQTEDMDMTTFLVYLLASLGIADAYQDVMAAYKAQRVDTQMIRASAARQLLLGKVNEEDFAQHTFWQLYDEYGPVAPA